MEQQNKVNILLGLEVIGAYATQFPDTFQALTEEELLAKELMQIATYAYQRKIKLATLIIERIERAEEAYNSRKVPTQSGQPNSGKP